jgi:hypothetical protein
MKQLLGPVLGCFRVRGPARDGLNAADLNAARCHAASPSDHHRRRRCRGQRTAAVNTSGLQGSAGAGTLTHLARLQVSRAPPLPPPLLLLNSSAHVACNASCSLVGACVPLEADLMLLSFNMPAADLALELPPLPRASATKVSGGGVQTTAVSCGGVGVGTPRPSCNSSSSTLDWQQHAHNNMEGSSHVAGNSDAQVGMRVGCALRRLPCN